MSNHERSEVIPQFHKPNDNVFSLQSLPVRLISNWCTLRGLIRTDLVEGVEVGTMMGLANWVKENRVVLSFKGSSSYYSFEMKERNRCGLEKFLGNR